MHGFKKIGMFSIWKTKTQLWQTNLSVFLVSLFLALNSLNLAKTFIPPPQLLVLRQEFEPLSVIISTALSDLLTVLCPSSCVDILPPLSDGKLTKRCEVLGNIIGRCRKRHLSRFWSLGDGLTSVSQSKLRRPSLFTCNMLSCSNWVNEQWVTLSIIFYWVLRNDWDDRHNYGNVVSINRNRLYFNLHGFILAWVVAPFLTVICFSLPAL